MFCIVSLPIRSEHSSVKVDECGLKNTFLFFNNGLLASGGSFSKTSKPAPKIKSFYNASFKSISLTTPPLEVLIMIELFFIELNIFLLIKFFVFSVNGT